LELGVSGGSLRSVANLTAEELAEVGAVGDSVGLGSARKDSDGGSCSGLWWGGCRGW
jgi:hypothetical protein